MTKRRVVEMNDGTYRLQYKVWPFWYTHDRVYIGRQNAINAYNDMAKLDKTMQMKRRKFGIKRVVYP